MIFHGLFNLKKKMLNYGKKSSFEKSQFEPQNESRTVLNVIVFEIGHEITHGTWD